MRLTRHVMVAVLTAVALVVIGVSSVWGEAGSRAGKPLRLQLPSGPGMPVRSGSRGRDRPGN